MAKQWRRWLGGELRQAADWLALGVGYEEIGRRLGRTGRSVEGALAHYRLQHRRPRLADHEAALRRWHSRGWCDRRVAERLGVSAPCVAGWRYRLGLAANGAAPADRRNGYRAACLSAGVSSLGELRSVQKRLRALQPPAHFQQG